MYVRKIEEGDAVDDAEGRLDVIVNVNMGPVDRMRLECGRCAAL